MSADLLRACGLRCTANRQAILDTLQQHHEPMTAEKIHELAGQDHSLGLSTTYRVLSQLVEHGLVLKNDGVDGFSYYQLNSHTHRHTLHCSICGAVVFVQHCPLESLEAQLSAQTGYTITSHSLSFTGICPKCQQNKKAETFSSCTCK